MAVQAESSLLKAFGGHMIGTVATEGQHKRFSA